MMSDMTTDSKSKEKMKVVEQRLQIVQMSLNEKWLWCSYDAVRKVTDNWNTYLHCQVCISELNKDFDDILHSIPVHIREIDTELGQCITVSYSFIYSAN